MKKLILFIVVSVVSGSVVAGSDTLSGRVNTVIDGNTLEFVSENNELHKVQLSGIDSPELGQEFGDKAKAHLEQIILHKNVTVTITGKDRWGNYLATVWIDGNVDVRVELLKAGLAWTAERNPLPELEAIKEEARQDERGLWKQESPTAPWVYRRQQSMMQVKGS
jgi:endonuclease YncB( thermonuclease family)